MYDEGRFKLWFDYTPNGASLSAGYAEMVAAANREAFELGQFTVKQGNDKPMMNNWPNPAVVKVDGFYFSFSDAGGYSVPGSVSPWQTRKTTLAGSRDGRTWKLLGNLDHDFACGSSHVPEAYVEGERLYLTTGCQNGCQGHKCRKPDGTLDPSLYDFRYGRITMKSANVADLKRLMDPMIPRDISCSVRKLPLGQNSIGGPSGNYASTTLPGWEPSSLSDGRYDTAYSSPSQPNYNFPVTVGLWFEPSAGPFKVTSLRLHARRGASGQPLAFPARYHVYLTSPDNSAWVHHSTQVAQPDADLRVSISVASLQTHGVLIVADTLSTDGYNHYLQLAEVEAFGKDARCP